MGRSGAGGILAGQYQFKTGMMVRRKRYGMSTGRPLSKAELARIRKARAEADMAKKQEERKLQQQRNCRCTHSCCRLPNRPWAWRCCKCSHGCPCFGAEGIPCGNTCICAIHVAAAALSDTEASSASDTSVDCALVVALVRAWGYLAAKVPLNRGSCASRST